MGTDFTDWQTGLLDAIASDVPPSAPPPGVTEAALAIYRGNYRLALLDTLSRTYPVCRQLVGDTCFDLIGRRFLATAPSRSGNLHDFGSELGEFIARTGNGLPSYLADVAALEWLAHRAYYARDTRPASLDMLASLPGETWPALRLEFIPSFGVILSSYPVASLWLAHLAPDPSFAGSLNLPECAMVTREQGRIDVKALPIAEGRFLEALQTSHTLEHATDAALGVDETFSPLPLLSLLFAKGQIHRIIPA
ncbi:HvfC/BufC N-terminal domain-containing protein [Paludibacterium paludis]|uniref:DUF2063 domain-containing protein n=1 Tax=Paludibacterium paludis TaxID=1225769 RepID=A0A918P0Z2_9NEIS|nr:DNA-binding domain-containing protein [Paludibacterium paludis]GGY11228.1 DUF2063 domain-containing protein [Paludibacterium paludis]